MTSFSQCQHIFIKMDGKSNLLFPAKDLKRQKISQSISLNPAMYMYKTYVRDTLGNQISYQIKKK